MHRGGREGQGGRGEGGEGRGKCGVCWGTNGGRE